MEILTRVKRKFKKNEQSLSVDSRQLFQSDSKKFLIEPDDTAQKNKQTENRIPSGCRYLDSLPSGITEYPALFRFVGVLSNKIKSDDKNVQGLSDWDVTEVCG